MALSTNICVLHSIRKYHVFEIESWYILDRTVKRQLGPHFSKRAPTDFSCSSSAGLRRSCTELLLIYKKF